MQRARVRRAAPTYLYPTNWNPDHDDAGNRIAAPHEAAPDFRAHTTYGDRSLANYRCKWLVLSSHPADFAPVFANEFIAFARAGEGYETTDWYFSKRAL